MMQAAQHSLEVKTALATGASRGIDRAIASGWPRTARVVIGCLKNDAQARDVVKTITDAGGRAAAAQADLSRTTEVTVQPHRRPERCCRPRRASRQRCGTGVTAQNISAGSGAF
jgi:NAD(P)-dependent dehydrogenase (short-subunit alcohol dehydrogenase family)